MRFVVASIERFVCGLFDYAGTFPPARLSMDDAVDQFVRLLESPEKALVSRLVCSSDRLQELVAAYKKRHLMPSINVSVIGAASSDYAGWKKALDHDATAITEFNKNSPSCLNIEAYEPKVPSNELIAECLKDLRGWEDLEIYAELRWGEGLEDAIAAIAETDDIGAKARTGGITAEAYPSVADLSAFLHSVCSLEVKFKLTAGLHHPLPTVDSVTGAVAHGFLNVTYATGLAIFQDFTRGEIGEVLADASLDDWVFDDRCASWRGHKLKTEYSEETRWLLRGIGSCSIDEPADAMRALGVWR